MFSAGDKTYTYNDRGQQTGYSNGTTAAAYAYNPSGLRKAKTVGGSTKYFVYNGMNIVYEYSETAADVTLAQAKIQQKNRAKARFFYILRTVLDNSAQTVYNYDSTDLRSVTVAADSGTSRKAVVYIKK